jgi:hypothetical protein
MYYFIVCTCCCCGLSSYAYLGLEPCLHETTRLELEARYKKRDYSIRLVRLLEELDGQVCVELLAHLSDL